MARLLALTGAGLGLGSSRALAGPLPLSAKDRRFLFVYTKGGWDPTWALAPMFDSPYVDVDDNSFETTAGDIPYVASWERPAVGQFMQDWSDRICLLHGMEVRAVTHGQCVQLVMTGTNDIRADDFASTLAGGASDLLLPSLVISGPSYTTRFASDIVRVGENGQLAGLLDGAALDDQEVQLPSPSGGEAIEDYVRRRAQEFRDASTDGGNGEKVAADLEASLDRLVDVRALAGEVDLTVEEPEDGYLPVSERAMPALTCLELGLSRVAMVEHTGLLGKNWDTHANAHMQSAHYQVLFEDLAILLEELETRPGPAGGSLLDETCVVVFSEMGRAPQLNAMFGKDHWTYTSAMLLGSGVAGGQVVGGYDVGLIGEPTDFATGDVSSTGRRITSADFGATLLALGDEESAIGEPVTAILA
ncbi:MAG: DUF1501 domain-containing protein [Proteobacteria bacterium]|nr:DUF1501 domain-containing protein [Pseudomonadota bacterium]MCP4917294.1 DUF1501 domain-containing protein [Pseudomonadota bacterium]